MSDARLEQGREEPKRPLTPQEFGLIAGILEQDFPGSRELRQQLDTAVVAGNWSQRSASIDLSVPATQGRAPVRDGVLPVDIEVYDSDKTYVGELLIWISDGLLSAVEYAWVTDDAPERLPDFGDVVVKRKSG